MKRVKRGHTKEEITSKDGKTRQGCTVIKKGEVYESHLFSVKDDRYKSEAFLEGEKEFYTTLINSYISYSEQHSNVFDKNCVYLPNKKIGKSNPKEAEIKADNEARQEWNRTVDMALVTGIAKAKIMKIKQTEIQGKASISIRKKRLSTRYVPQCHQQDKRFFANSYPRTGYAAEAYAQYQYDGVSHYAAA